MTPPASRSQDRAILLELDRVLESRVFSSARRSRGFLRYVVEHSLAHPGDHLKEYSLALDIFERDPSYDPSVNATVRVEAGRLRSRLREYYAGEGRDDPIVIEIPKGGYSAAFVSHTVPTLAPREVSQPPSHALRPAEIYSLRIRWMLLLFFLVGGLLGFLAAH